MIQEEYVSFELAKLLKEKGFDKEFDADIVRYYDEKGSLVNVDYMQLFVCPSLGMVIKYLREVHSIHIVIYPYTDKKGHNFSFVFDKFAYGCWQELGVYITDSWNSYEEACEAAIKYCLEHLI